MLHLDKLISHVSSLIKYETFMKLVLLHKHRTTFQKIMIFVK